MRLLAVLVSVVLIAGCGQSQAAGTRRITITGSSTVAPLVGEMAKRFEATHPGVRIDVQMGGSGKGIADARSGLAEIGMASRALKDDERDLVSRTIARDGICMIVHRENPVSGLTDAQVAGIYSGRVRNWKEVGGKDAPVTVVNKAEGRATLELFCQYFGLKTQDIRASVVIGDNEQGVKTVQGNPDAIGYVSIGTAEVDLAAGVPIRLLPVNGVAATLANVENGTFPISRPLILVVKGAPSDLLKEFLDFAASAAVNDLVKAQSFVPIAK